MVRGKDNEFNGKQKILHKSRANSIAKFVIALCENGSAKKSVRVVIRSNCLLT